MNALVKSVKYPILQQLIIDIQAVSVFMQIFLRMCTKFSYELYQFSIKFNVGKKEEEQFDCVRNTFYSNSKTLLKNGKRKKEMMEEMGENNKCCAISGCIRYAG